MEHVQILALLRKIKHASRSQGIDFNCVSRRCEEGDEKSKEASQAHTDLILLERVVKSDGCSSVNNYVCLIC